MRFASLFIATAIGVLPIFAAPVPSSRAFKSLENIDIPRGQLIERGWREAALQMLGETRAGEIIPNVEQVKALQKLISGSAIFTQATDANPAMISQKLEGMSALWKIVFPKSNLGFSAEELTAQMTEDLEKLANGKKAISQDAWYALMSKGDELQTAMNNALAEATETAKKQQIKALEKEGDAAKLGAFSQMQKIKDLAASGSVIPGSTGHGAESVDAIIAAHLAKTQ